MNIEILIAKLMEFYNIKTITELAQIINTTQPTISGWRSRNAVGALVEKVAEHDNKVLEYIFTSPSNTQTIQTVSSGQVAQTVNGDMVGGENKKENNCKDIDPATLSLFNEAYLKAKDKDDLKGFRVHLMDY